ncbi:hypothetical protein VZT92_023746 [Zoarces viviparus]|uniref:Uncharacterized protein n=1 Tax=Zoarces viviparus TaxID=48416 RepID=A0AAW1E810_ZOAVI
MDQCFRIALWMFCLIGYLQAKPVSSGQDDLRLCSGQDDLRLCSLARDVECENVTFASPTNVEVNCFDAALQSFKGGLVRARASCKDEDERINDTLETLARFPSTNSTECTLDTKASQFKDFVKDLETFVQRVNTNSRT